MHADDKVSSKELHATNFAKLPKVVFNTLVNGVETAAEIAAVGVGVIGITELLIHNGLSVPGSNGISTAGPVTLQSIRPYQPPGMPDFVNNYGMWWDSVTGALDMFAHALTLNSGTDQIDMSENNVTNINQITNVQEIHCDKLKTSEGADLITVAHGEFDTATIHCSTTVSGPVNCT